MAFLAAGGAYNGVWATFFPRSFYDDFPGFGRHWAAEGPFNEHLIRDTGGLFLGLTVVTAFVIFRGRARDTYLLGAAWSAFGSLHFYYHVNHLDVWGLFDSVMGVIALGGSAFAALLLLLPARASTDPAGTSVHHFGKDTPA